MFDECFDKIEYIGRMTKLKLEVLGMDDKTMYNLTYGLFILMAHQEGKDNGCIINTVMQVTVMPNKIAIAVNKSNFTHDMIMETHKFNISILSEQAGMPLFERFGFQSGKTVDKLKDFSAVERSENGILYVTEGVNSFLSAEVESVIDIGTHTLFIASIVDMQTLNDLPSVTYAYYQKNIKPKPKAVSASEEGKVVWRCTVCGYEYVGEDIPEDFICPICKHPVSDFEKIEPKA